MKHKIILNQAQCLSCNAIITSKHRHDYVTCTCGQLAVDGGHDYCKRNFTDYSKIHEMSIIEEVGDDEGYNN